MAVARPGYRCGDLARAGMATRLSRRFAGRGAGAGEPAVGGVKDVGQKNAGGGATTRKIGGDRPHPAVGTSEATGSRVQGLPSLSAQGKRGFRRRRVTEENQRMFEELEKINERPKPFEFYTASDLWSDEHTSK